MVCFSYELCQPTVNSLDMPFSSDCAQGYTTTAPGFGLWTPSLLNIRFWHYEYWWNRGTSLQMAVAGCGPCGVGRLVFIAATALAIQRFEGHGILSSGRMEVKTALPHFVLMPFLHPLHVTFRLSSLYLLYFKPLLSNRETHFGQNKYLVICNMYTVNTPLCISLS